MSHILKVKINADDQWQEVSGAPIITNIMQATSKILCDVGRKDSDFNRTILIIFADSTDLEEICKCVATQLNGLLECNLSPDYLSVPFTEKNVGSVKIILNNENHINKVVETIIKSDNVISIEQIINVNQSPYNTIQILLENSSFGRDDLQSVFFIFPNKSSSEEMVEKILSIFARVSNKEYTAYRYTNTWDEYENENSSIIEYIDKIGLTDSERRNLKNSLRSVDRLDEMDKSEKISFFTSKLKEICSIENDLKLKNDSSFEKGER